MRTLFRSFVAIAVIGSSSVWSHGDVSCNIPKAEWRPSVELQGELQKIGWKVRTIQVENGCYEVYGFDENDKRVEAFFNPKTFERVL